MSAEEWLGLPLEEALRRLREAGLPEPRVVFAGEDRRPEGDGTPRLIRVRGEEWVCARFRDGEPQRAAL